MVQWWGKEETNLDGTQEAATTEEEMKEMDEATGKVHMTEVRG